MVLLGVKIIAFLEIIASIFFIIIGFLLKKHLGFGLSSFEFIKITFLISGMIGLITGIYLWKCKNWARILTIVFALSGSISGFFAIIIDNYGSSIYSGIGLLSGLSGFIIINNEYGPIFSLILNGIIVIYLLVNKKVKKAFA